MTGSFSSLDFLGLDAQFNRAVVGAGDRGQDVGGLNVRLEGGAGEKIINSPSDVIGADFAAVTPP